MAVYNKPESKSDYERNFAEKNPLMSASEAFIESSRCLFCYDAPCITACPTHIDIPLFIKQIHTGNVEGSARTIFDSNWLGSACGKVCPTSVLCEGACVYNHENKKPIEIGRLQYYATRQVIEAEKPLYGPGTPNGRKIAVVGAGPAGIACACELRLMGYEVDIFEAKDKPSGLTVHGTAPYKITNEQALEEMAYLQDQMRYVIHYNTPIETNEQIVALESKYDAVFLGVGIGPTAELKVNGESSERVLGAVEFVEELRAKQHQMDVPDRVIVLGGGNTAMDAASETARMGAKSVVLAYRRSHEDMGAYSFEYDLAVSAGVKGLFHVAPLEIRDSADGVAVTFIRTRHENGKLEFITGSEFVLEADWVIKATGQSKMGSFFSMIDSLQLDKSRRVIVDPITFQTTNPKYFAGGDAVNGGAEVVNGAFDGKMAARGIDDWLNNRLATT